MERGGRRAYVDDDFAIEGPLGLEIDLAIRHADDLRAEIAAWYDEISPLRLTGDEPVA